MNKKAIAEYVLNPTFVTIIALGIVGLTIFNSVVEIGTSKAYDEKVYATRNALIRDALQALPKDINAQAEITIPEKLGLEIDQHSMRAYFIQPGHTFYYTKSQDYILLDAKFDPEKNNSPLLHYKTGNTIGTISKGLNPNLIPNLLIPYCPETRQYNVQIDKQAILNYGTTPVRLMTGEITIDAVQGTGTKPTLKIYTNTNQEAACHIIQNILQEFPIKGAAIIPVNKELIPSNDPRKASMLIEISGVTITSTSDKAKLASAINKGARNE